MRKKKKAKAVSKERSADKRPPTDRRINTGQNFNGRDRSLTQQ